jgi:hypothetical protein
MTPAFRLPFFPFRGISPSGLSDFTHLCSAAILWRGHEGRLWVGPSGLIVSARTTAFGATSPSVRVNANDRVRSGHSLLL